MNILTYSPKVEAYVATTQKDGTIKYYDLSQDITSATVVRNIDEASMFTIHLQNKNNKYDNLFTPMDRVIIYAIGAPQNGENRRYALIAGYIKKANKMRLYNEDFIIEGRDSLYRLQEYFWDPGLYESQELVKSPQFVKDADGGGAQALVNLLTCVVGMQEENILIGNIPGEVIEFARELYKAEQEDDKLSREQLDQFHKMLKDYGKKLTQSGGGSGVAGEANFEGSDAIEKVWNFCISQGFSKEAAAATIGNIMQESSGNPACCQGGGGPGRGLFQWEIGSDRFARLEQIAASMGKQWSDVEPQLTLFEEELPGEFQKYTGKEYWKPPYQKYGTWWPEKVTFDQWKTWTDIPKATECLERVYMRPSMPNRQRRIAMAEEAYKKYANR